MKLKNSYKAVFTTELKEEHHKEWLTFFKAYENAMFTQHPDWIALSQPKRKVNYFMLYADEGQLMAISTIVENKIVANVLWGPLCNSIEVYVDCIELIIAHYKKRKKFAQLRITQPKTISNETETIEYEVFKRIPFKQYVNDKNLFTIAVNLEKNGDDILDAFNKSNKRGVKKGIKEGFEIREISEGSEVEKFAKIFDEMIQARGIENQFTDTNSTFKNILSKFNSEGFGKILAVYNTENIMMGGIMILFKDDFVHYDTGASSPEFRKIPIMHSLFYNAMLMSKEMGHKWFDLGGYNLISAEGDQVTNINKFKEGFAGVPQIYPKKMYFTINPILNTLFNLAMKLKG